MHFLLAALTIHRHDDPLHDTGPPRPRTAGLPPSLPEAPHQQHEDYYRPAAPDHVWVWMSGFIGAGNDVAPPATMSLQLALDRCDALPRCRAITFEGDNSTKRPKAYFKAVALVGGSPGWCSSICLNCGFNR